MYIHTHTQTDTHTTQTQVRQHIELLDIYIYTIYYIYIYFGLGVLPGYAISKLSHLQRVHFRLEPKERLLARGEWGEEKRT